MADRARTSISSTMCWSAIESHLSIDRAKIHKSINRHIQFLDLVKLPAGSAFYDYARPEKTTGYSGFFAHCLR
jgi:hypothetical protein